MSQATDKIESHVSVLLKHRLLTKEEAEHFVRHFKGMLHGVGELLEEKIKHLTT